jgi:acyl-coenzyme A thioesterase PaaI-like protein
VSEPTALTLGGDLLADAVRRLMLATVLTEVPEADVLAAAEAIDAVTDTLTAQQRRGPWRPDPRAPRASPYNAVVGPGNPVAVPMELTRLSADGVSARVRFGAAYEGAPGLVHGGIVSLVFDQLLGEAAIAARVPGMTVGLEIRYAAPTPIDTELLLEAHVEESTDRKVRLVGSMRAGQVTTATATGTFFRLTEAHARKIFPHMGTE